MRRLKDQRGLTLIELLVVVTILGILAAAIFVALNPVKLFKDSRDVVRRQDVETILTAIGLYQVNSGGINPTEIQGLTAGRVYMITDGAQATGCDDYGTNGCDTEVYGDSYCADLDELVDNGYLGDIPISPTGTTTWSEDMTGYTIEKSSNGNIFIRACESESGDEIWVVR